MTHANPSLSDAARRVFTVRLVYFKPSGKLYASAEVTREFATTAAGCYMNDVTDWVRRSQGGGLPLPGLASDRWGGPILVDCDEGFPCLILPRAGG
jgi:hypothetical protein